MRDDFYIALDNYIQVKSSESELSVYILDKVPELPDYILDYLNFVRDIVLKSEYLIKIAKIKSKFVYMKGYTLYLDKGCLCLEKTNNDTMEKRDTYYRLNEKDRHRLINEIIQFNGKRI